MSTIESHGLDLSHHNVDAFGPYNWQAIANDGIRWISAKLTEGTGFVDNKAGVLVNGARSAGIKAGGYHFAQNGPVASEVNHFVNHLNHYGLLEDGSFWPMLDMESSAVRPIANSYIADFIHEYRNRTGRRGISVYANLDWWKNTLLPNQWADADVVLWIARYNGDPGNPGWSHPKLALHQHTSSGHVPGCPDQTIDKNVIYNGWSLADLTFGMAAAPPDDGRQRRQHFLANS